MRRWLVLAVLAVGGVVGSSNKADAFFFCRGWGCWGMGEYCPTYGYYPGGYYYPQYYPWFTYYNYYWSPYAGYFWPNPYTVWPGYLAQGADVGIPTGGLTAAPATGGVVVASLPADAELLFNGVAATGSGETRAFSTPALTPGQEYAYELTAKRVKDGKVETVTEKVIVTAGKQTKVALRFKDADTGVATASATK